VLKNEVKNIPNTLQITKMAKMESFAVVFDILRSHRKTLHCTWYSSG